MLSSSLHTMLKSSKTTSPNKLFDYDCVTLYKNRDLICTYITHNKLYMNRIWHCDKKK